jgi:hypothetical protein
MDLRRSSLIVWQLYRRNEAISETGNGFNEARLLCCIAKGFAELAYGVVNAVIKFHEGVARPKTLPDLFSSYEFVRLLEEEFQELKRLSLKADMPTLLG